MTGQREVRRLAKGIGARRRPDGVELPDRAAVRRQAKAQGGKRHGTGKPEAPKLRALARRLGRRRST